MAAENLTRCAQRLASTLPDPVNSEPASESFVHALLRRVRVCSQDLAEASRFVGELSGAEGFLQDSVSPLRFVGSVFRLESAVLEEGLREPFVNLTARIAELEPHVTETMAAQFRAVSETRSVIDAVHADLVTVALTAEASIEQLCLECPPARPDPWNSSNAITAIVAEGEAIVRDWNAEAPAKLRRNDEELAGALELIVPEKPQSNPLDAVLTSLIATVRRSREFINPFTKRAQLAVPLDRLVRQMRLISLNAQLQSAKSGKGIGLDVLAARAAGVSLETAQLASLMTARMDEFAASITRTVVALDRIARDTEMHMKAARSATPDRSGLRQVIDDLHRAAAVRSEAADLAAKELDRIQR